MTKIIEVDPNNLEYGLEIIQQISEYRPYSSISFPSSIEIINAIDEIMQLAERGMGKNKHKMKQAVLEILESIAACSPGDPVNLNLTKYEHESVKALIKITERSVKNK